MILSVHSAVWHIENMQIEIGTRRIPDVINMLFQNIQIKQILVRFIPQGNVAAVGYTEFVKLQIPFAVRKIPEDYFDFVYVDHILSFCDNKNPRSTITCSRI